ncbi:NTP transferase domain-containing protein [Petrotoga sp. 9PWA.NaAc.5.4]|uniref:nucleotidyltransferase family protein n=1 Tax=Petrotoga sp. 9PWA.NaAc.5.4 TaxID=1434328 RepID=UPI000CA6CBE2|nr:nucleotidyltransferase family protein [Petrotoga sp. 9PWA.NaAc.5.4]PNR96816.1 hypothetical protein X924_01870 [Petrotoga sp. 9PWA.NaAc.5.4]
MFTAVILAAGESMRMGTAKQVLPWRNSTVLETVLKAVLNCCYVDDEVRVVLGGNYEQIIPFFSNYKDPRIKILLNNSYEKGMITSVWKGIENVPNNSQYILFTLGDMPLISIETYNKLAKFAIKEGVLILAPVYKNKRGHPLVVHKSQIKDIYDLKGPGGLRTLLSSHPERVVFYEVDDEGTVIDLDTVEDYKKYL